MDREAWQATVQGVKKRIRNKSLYIQVYSWPFSNIEGGWDLPNPGTEHESPESPALGGWFFSTVQPLLRRTERSGVTQNVVFPFLYQSLEGSFHKYSLWISSGTLWGKLKKVWGVPMTKDPRILNSELSTLSIQQFINYSAGFSTATLVPMKVSANGFLLR